MWRHFWWRPMTSSRPLSPKWRHSMTWRGRIIIRLGLYNMFLVFEGQVIWSTWRCFMDKWVTQLDSPFLHEIWVIFIWPGMTFFAGSSPLEGELRHFNTLPNSCGIWIVVTETYDLLTKKDRTVFLRSWDVKITSSADGLQIVSQLRFTVLTFRLC